MLYVYCYFYCLLKLIAGLVGFSVSFSGIVGNYYGQCNGFGSEFIFGLLTGSGNSECNYKEISL